MSAPPPPSPGDEGVPGGAGAGMQTTGSSKKKKQPGSSKTLKKVIHDLAEEVKCALCLEFFEKPRILSCLHTFCASCLKELVTDNRVTCPLCRHVQELNETGIEGLRVNHQLLNIADKMRTASQRRCNECRKDLAAEYCKHCHHYLCTACSAKIHALRLLRGHERRPLDPGGSDPEGSEEFSSSSSPSSPSPSPPPASPSTAGLFALSRLQPPASSVVQPDDVIVRFAVKRDRCLEHFRNWVKSMWFAPMDFRSGCAIRKVRPLLAPFWLFEVETKTSYTASVAGPRGVPGSLSVSPPPKDFLLGAQISGEVTGRFRVAVCACDTLDSALLGRIEPWELDDLHPPATSDNAGSGSSGEEAEARVTASAGIPRAQVLAHTLDSPAAYNQGGEGANVAARVTQMAVEKANQDAREKAGFMSSARNVRTRCTISRVGAQRVFMPVWVIKYLYGGKSYYAVVNGQNGRIDGDRPYSVGKVASLSLTGIGALVGLLASATTK